MTTDLIIELYHMVPLDEKKHHVVSLATSYYSDLITVTVAGALVCLAVVCAVRMIHANTGVHI